jgi:hypothetical protein
MPALMPTNMILTGPVTGGRRGLAVLSALADLTSVGYLAEEFFLDGTVAAYEAAPGAELAVDGARVVATILTNRGRTSAGSSS